MATDCSGCPPSYTMEVPYRECHTPYTAFCTEATIVLPRMANSCVWGPGACGGGWTVIHGLSHYGHEIGGVLEEGWGFKVLCGCCGIQLHYFLEDEGNGDCPPVGDYELVEEIHMKVAPAEGEGPVRAGSVRIGKTTAQ